MFTPSLFASACALKALERARGLKALERARGLKALERACASTALWAIHGGVA